MAEILGIVSGVLGLLPLCRDGMTMIRDTFRASEGIELAMDRVILQRDQYDEWTEIWKTPKGETERFELYAKSNPNSALRVLTQLGRLSKVLFDAEELRNKYGLKPARGLEQEDLRGLSLPTPEKWQHLSQTEVQKKFTRKCKSNLSFIAKCKFIMRKDDKHWDDLIGLLKEYNNNLRTYGPRDDLVKMIKKQYDILNRIQSEMLLRIAAASRYEAKISSAADKRTTPYGDIALAANFKATINYVNRRNAFHSFKMEDFRIESNYRLPSSQKATMALLWDFPFKNSRRVVLIEWIDDFDPDQKGFTENKASMLCAPKPGQLLIPNCYGMVEGRGRFGLVLVPPEHIRTHLPTVLSSGSISQRRMPVSLKALLDRVFPIDLGIRFRLAKKLLDAVHMMHSVGWVHKNIRSESIIFFPAKSKITHGPVEETPPLLGYDEPYFVGFGRAREVLAQEDKARVTRMYYDVKSERKYDINLDFYQHPVKRRDPQVRYSRSFDIYSLGCVLLEIGLWKPLSAVTDPDISEDEFARGLQNCAKNSDGITGSIYAELVYKCLSIDPAHPAVSDFCVDIAALLNRCVA